MVETSWSKAARLRIANQKGLPMESFNTKTYQVHPLDTSWDFLATFCLLRTCRVSFLELEQIFVGSQNMRLSRTR